MQKIHLIGNLTKDPNLRTTQSGVSVCSFTIAVDRRHFGSGEKKTDFFSINAWRGLGENCAKFLSKGKKVAVIGELQAREYEANGTKRFSLDVQADEIEFLSPKGQTAAEPQGPIDLSGFQEIDEDEPLPF